MGETYKIVRYFARGGRRTIKTGLTLEAAQAHTDDPETASATAKGIKARRITQQSGPWFDGYRKEE